MANRDIIVIGGSAGGVDAMIQLVRALPEDLPAAIFVVIHVPANGSGSLPQILSRWGKLPASAPQDGEEIRRGRIYVAPPNHHIHIEGDRIRVVHGPKENGHRPAVDPLFRTAARHCGSRVIGVILSGTLDDGTAGLLAVKRHGGVALVQDPEDALFSGMPLSAVENVAVDLVAPLEQIPEALARLTRETIPEETAPADSQSSEGLKEVSLPIWENEMTNGHDPDLPQNDYKNGDTTGFTCPECHGALWEVRDGELTRFRCRVGHAFSADSLMASQSDALEAALWMALRSLEEKGALAAKMAERARERLHHISAGHFASQARECEAQADVIRQVLEQGYGIGSGADETGGAMGQPSAGAHA